MALHFLSTTGPFGIVTLKMNAKSKKEIYWGGSGVWKHRDRLEKKKKKKKRLPGKEKDEGAAGTLQTLNPRTSSIELLMRFVEEAGDGGRAGSSAWVGGGDTGSGVAEV